MQRNQVLKNGKINCEIHHIYLKISINLIKTINELFDIH
jgi:hypothetical protein